MSTPRIQTLIATSEFYLSPSLDNTLASSATSIFATIPAPMLTKLKASVPSRLRDMRSSGTALRILSHVPIDCTPKACQRVNDMIHSSILTNPDRFAAMAFLPSSDPKEAANELQRCVTRYKFVGGMLVFRRDGEHDVNREEWDALWTMAEKYKVPIALQPALPGQDQVQNQSVYYEISILHSNGRVYS